MITKEDLRKDICTGEIKHSSINFDTGIKNHFKAEVSLNGSEMSTVIQEFALSYIFESRKLRQNLKEVRDHSKSSFLNDKTEDNGKAEGK